jgi:predicted glycoside hydrolase/deacetylase ChbG (UPF0249 family)
MKHLVFINILAMLMVTNIILHAGGDLRTGEDTLTGENDNIKLIVRADDMGFSRACNVACIKGYREGIITTVEVLVPGPWFLDAADLLADNPGLDAGVHLALTSEWANYKWGPVTNAKSLVTGEGYFHTRVEPLRELNLDIAEVEAELRAQIELAIKYIPQLSHISDHMNVASCRPDIRELVDRLSKEYNLPLAPDGLTGSFELWAVPPEEKEGALADSLGKLENGLWELICHPALNNEETQGIKGTVYDPDIRMALHRQAVTDALTGEKIKDIIRQREIKLVSYSDTYINK